MNFMVNIYKLISFHKLFCNTHQLQTLSVIWYEVLLYLHRIVVSVHRSRVALIQTSVIRPVHVIISQQRASEFSRQPFLELGWLTFAHLVQHTSGIRGNWINSTMQQGSQGSGGTFLLNGISSNWIVCKFQQNSSGYPLNVLIGGIEQLQSRERS